MTCGHATLQSYMSNSPAQHAEAAVDFGIIVREVMSQKPNLAAGYENRVRNCHI